MRLAAGLALAGSLALGAAAPLPGWDEIVWPFGRDAWPAGRAYRCRDCDLEVYVRAKLGFCNCTTGVSDDAEVDALGDVDMIATDFVPVAAGVEMAAAGLRGRGRRYVLPGGRGAAGIALSSKCDLLVAAAVGRDAADIGRVGRLLDSPAVATWIAAVLGRKRLGA